MRKARRRHLTPLAVSIDQACEMIGVGRTSLYEAMKDGRLACRKVGNRTIILVADIEKFLDELPRGEVR
jgi:excisionase family DNA binding protein